MITNSVSGSGVGMGVGDGVAVGRGVKVDVMVGIGVYVGTMKRVGNLARMSSVGGDGVMLRVQPMSNTHNKQPVITILRFIPFYLRLGVVPKGRGLLGAGRWGTLPLDLDTGLLSAGGGALLTNLVY